MVNGQWCLMSYVQVGEWKMHKVSISRYIFINLMHLISNKWCLSHTSFGCWWKYDFEWNNCVDTDIDWFIVLTRWLLIILFYLFIIIISRGSVKRMAIKILTKCRKRIYANQSIIENAYFILFSRHTRKRIHRVNFSMHHLIYWRKCDQIFHLDSTISLKLADCHHLSLMVNSQFSRAFTDNTVLRQSDNIFLISHVFE